MKIIPNFILRNPISDVNRNANRLISALFRPAVLCSSVSCTQLIFNAQRRNEEEEEERELLCVCAGVSALTAASLL